LPCDLRAKQNYNSALFFQKKGLNFLVSPRGKNRLLYAAFIFVVKELALLFVDTNYQYL